MGEREATRALTGDPPDLASNDVVRLSGVVTLFRDQPQITVTATRSIEVLPPGAALASTVSEPASASPIADVRAGTVAKVQGQVTAVESFSSGFKFTLQDDSGSLTLVLNEAVYKNIPGLDGLRSGAQVAAFGFAEIFRGQLEIQPVEADDVTLLAPGHPAGNPVAINTLGLTQIGQTLTIAGRITAVDKFSKGQRLTLDDGTGAITVLLWDNVLAYVPSAEKLKADQSVTVTGRLDQYQGALEIAPQIGFDVEVE